MTSLLKPQDLDGLECAVSVLLAIAVAHAIGAENVAWAAFSGYMVMRGHWADSVLRGALRIGGTLLGAALALLLVPIAERSLAASTVAAGLAAVLSLYGALTGRRAYAWLFIGLTFEMVLLDKLEHPALPIRDFATTRILEVCAGTAACVAVSALSAVTLRRRWPAARAPLARRLGWHPYAAPHASQGAVAVAVLPALSMFFHIPELAQAAVSVMAVMLVPVTSIGASGLIPVSRKLVQRVAGCLAGGLLAACILFLGHGKPAILLAGTLLGVLIGKRIEGRSQAAGYVGTQFVLAVLVTLVPDRYEHAALGPALDRLTGILIGMALLEPVLVLWHLVAPAVAAQPVTER